MDATQARDNLISCNRFQTNNASASPLLSLLQFFKIRWADRWSKAMHFSLELSSQTRSVLILNHPSWLVHPLTIFSRASSTQLLLPISLFNSRGYLRTLPPSKHCSSQCWPTHKSIHNSSQITPTLSLMLSSRVKISSLAAPQNPTLSVDLSAAESIRIRPWGIMSHWKSVICNLSSNHSVCGTVVNMKFLSASTSNPWFISMQHLVLSYST